MDNEMEQKIQQAIFEDMDSSVFEEMGAGMQEKIDSVGCSTVGYQDVTVSVPVTIKPFGEVGNAKTQCLGKAVISSGSDKCTGKTGEECKFTISQKLRVEVPVIFGARAEVGDATVDCGWVESVKNCNTCND